jgi:HJR/Mrr/RecB family endonuclease
MTEARGGPNRRLRLTVDFGAWSGDQRLPLEKFFREGLIVLDANVLLDLYQLTPDARTQVLNSLSDVLNRLWVPYQAVIEFSRNRKRVVIDRVSSFKQTKQALQSAADNAIDELEAAVGKLLRQRERNGTLREWAAADVGLDRKSMLVRLTGIMDPALAELDALSAEHDLYPRDVQQSDPLLSQIDKLLDGRIGPAYGSAELRALVEEAHEFRFPNQMPPGYLDAAKGTALLGAGDYLLWRQTIDKARLMSSDERMVLLITSDLKGDWWDLDTKKKPLGPRPELVQEMRDLAMADLLLVSLKDFLSGASKYLSSEVSETTLQELRALGQDNSLLLPDAFADISATPDLLSLSPYEFENLVHFMLIQLGYEVLRDSSAFTDHGFDFLLVESTEQGERTVIASAKRYRGPIRLATIHELLGALSTISADSAILITTGSSTNSANEAVQQSPVELIDGPALIELLASIGIRATIGSADSAD